MEDIQLDYALGVDIATWIAAIAGSVCVVVAALLALVAFLKAFFLIRNDSKVPSKKNVAAYLGIATFFTVFFIGILLSTVAMIWGFVYACANFFLNLDPWNLIAFVKSDLTSGSFSLRIVSIALPFSLITPARALLSGKKRKAENELSEDEKKEENQRQQKDNEKWSILTEGLICLAATSVLWYGLVRDGELMGLGILLSFVLLFIIDDWIILTHYRMETAGKIPWTHALRLFLAVLAIAVLMVATFFTMFSLLIAILLSLVVVPVLCMVVLHYAPRF